MNTSRAKYQLKTVIFDIQQECRELKKELSDAGLIVLVPFLGLFAKQTLEELASNETLCLQQGLMLTNNAEHAKLANSLGIVVVGCIEGNFEVPKSRTLLENPAEVSLNYLNLVYCHEKKLPALITETSRCIIRELTKDDMNALYEILIDKETAKYLQPKPGSKEEELDKLVSYASCVYPFFSYGYWGVFDKKTGELIGRAGFKEGEYPLEAGYVIKRSHWGKGLATEVLQGLVLYAQEELGCSELFANIDENNKASLRVAEKCGVVCNRLRSLS